MAIRQRISTGGETVVENVSIGKINKNDERGTVSLKGNPYEGSALDKFGVEQEHARTIGMALAYLFKAPHPNSVPVRDLLANLRMMNNPGWNIEYTYRQRARSPLTAIRGHCVVDCKSGSVREVSECKNMSCPLWALRLGRNAHYGKKG